MSLFEEIVNEIKLQGIPAFIKSMQKIAELTESEDGNISELCDVIMKDPGMTARVLRETNSAYNVRRGRTNTVSRAVVMLGIKEIRNICLASEIVDGLVISGCKEELVHEMVRAFYCAVQARLIAIQKRDRYSEEVYLGALVKRLGRIVFWKVDNPIVDKLSAALKDINEDPREIEKQILGFTLDELSEKIIELWKLENLIPPKNCTNKLFIDRTSQINLSNELATVSSIGLDSKIAEEVMQEMSEQLELEDSAIKSLIDRASKETVDTTLSYGLEEANNAIPELISDEVLEEKRAEMLEKFTSKEPNTAKRQEIIGNIKSLIERNADIRLIIFEILEALSQGSGFDRSVFAIVNQERNYISARLASAPDQTLILKKFRFKLDGNIDNFFTNSYINGSLQHYKPKQETEILYSDDFTLLFGKNEFLLAPIIIEDNYIGSLYADLSVSGRAITERHVDEFKTLVSITESVLNRNKS